MKTILGNRIALTLFTLSVAFHAPAQVPQTNQTDLADQSDIAVTIYNNNLALVRDRRSVSLNRGEITLKFMDVAQHIMPETVSLDSISDPGALRILEQNYEYDLMSPEKMMEKYIGKNVRLVNFSTELGFTEVTAELLSTNQGNVYRVGDEIFLGHPGYVVLPKIPEDLIAKPSLIWILESQANKQDIEATYLTHGISWRADYVITMDEDETTAAIAAWVTLNNQSGATYKNAELKVVAGDVNIAQPQPRFDGRTANVARAVESQVMREESFAEFHLYTLPRRTTIKHNQSKQVSLFTAEGVETIRRYEFRGNVRYYAQQFRRFEAQKVDVFVEFENREEFQLGVPLPAGIMRIYQPDSDGMLQFAGEDRIKHTAKDERIRLRMGTAFDVVGERTQTDYNKLSNQLYESAYEIKIRNHKETSVTVDVVEPIPGDWNILESSVPFEKKDAFTAVFSLNVEPDDEATLNYRIRVHY